MAAFRKFIGNFHVFNTFISSGLAGTKCFLRVTTRSLNNRAFLGTILKMELKLQSRFLACCESRLSRWSGASLTCPSYSSTSSIITRRVKARRLSTEHHKFQLWPPQMSKSHSALTRQKHSKTSNKKRGNKEESDSESSDEEFEDDQVIGGEENLKGAPAEFSVRQVYLKTLRADAVVSVGLNISRNKVDDLSYSSKLRVNGERLQKKSHMMEVWDTVDLVTEVSEGGTTVQRVQVIKVDAKKTGKDKLSVWIRVWKKGFVVA